MASVRAEDVVEVDPPSGSGQELGRGADVDEVRAIELLVVGAMAAFHPAIVLLATLGVAVQGALEGGMRVGLSPPNSSPQSV